MSDSSELRRRAEQVLNRNAAEAQPVPREVRDLIRELQIHQIELEMQNASLVDAHILLDNARERYFDLYDLAPVGYLSLRADALILDANRAASALLCRDREDLLGQRFSRMIDSAYIEDFTRHFRAVLASDTPQTCLVELRVDDKSTREVRLESVSAASDADHAMRVALIDVTEINRLERELRQHQQLDAISNLASGVAHEFNNRLTAIVGCAEAAQKEMPAESGSSVLLEHIKEAALRGRSVATQLLSFARKDIHDESCQLDAAVVASAPLLRQILGDRVRLDFELGAPDACVHLSAGLVEQLLLTLASNTRDAIGESGTLRIETKRIHGLASREESSSNAAASGHVLLRCIDDGSGMDRETRARAFEPFYTTKAVGSGVGLGLALVHGIVQRAGGRIELSSKVHEGTEFRFHLPFAAEGRLEKTADPVLQPIDESVLVGARVLVVEDEPLILSNITNHLVSLGCEVFQAAGYDAALAQLRARGRSLHLVISDVVLQNDVRSSHLEAAIQLHELGAHVLFISAHPAGMLFRNKWLEPGSRVLEKPFTGDELKRAVLHALAFRQAARPT